MGKPSGHWIGSPGTKGAPRRRARRTPWHRRRQFEPVAQPTSFIRFPRIPCSFPFVPFSVAYLPLHAAATGAGWARHNEEERAKGNGGEHGHTMKGIGVGLAQFADPKRGQE